MMTPMMSPMMPPMMTPMMTPNVYSKTDYNDTSQVKSNILVAVFE